MKAAVGSVVAAWVLVCLCYWLCPFPGSPQVSRESAEIPQCLGLALGLSSPLTCSGSQSPHSWDLSCLILGLEGRPLAHFLTCGHWGVYGCERLWKPWLAGKAAVGAAWLQARPEELLPEYGLPAFILPATVPGSFPVPESPAQKMPIA